MKEISSKLSLKSHSTYSNWEYDRTQPDAEMLSKLSSVFDVTTDYLLGKDDLYNKKEDKNEMIIREIVKKYNLDLTIDGTREKVEQIIRLVLDDHSRKQ